MLLHAWQEMSDTLQFPWVLTLLHCLQGGGRSQLLVRVSWHGVVV
jgi:hypothetical protein